MAQKPDRKGAPQDGKPKKKKGKGGLVIFWLITIVVAFFIGFFVAWKYREPIQSSITSVFGDAADKMAKEEVLSALNESTLEAAAKESGKKAIEVAYSKNDVKLTAKGEYEYKIAKQDDKITKDEWEDIIGAYGG